MRTKGGVICILCLILLSGLAGLMAEIIRFAPDGAFVSVARLTLKEGEKQSVLWQDLGLAHRSQYALAIDRSASPSHWVLTGPAIGLAEDGLVRPLSSWQVQHGDRFQVGALRFHVALDGLNMRLTTEDGRQAHWAGTRLETQGPFLPACSISADAQNQTVLGRIRSALTFPALIPTDGPMFAIGGQVSCPRRWALAELPANAISFHRVGGRVWLSGDAALLPAAARSGDATLQPLAAKGLVIRANSPEPVAFRLGHSRMMAWADGDTLLLVPLNGRKRLSTPPSALPYLTLDAMGPPWSIPLAETPFELILVGTIGLGLGACVGLFSLTLIPVASISGLVLRCLTLAQACGIGLACAWLAGVGPIGFVPSLALAGLAWASCSILLAAGGRLENEAGWFWLLTVLLAGAGLVMQTQLAVGHTTDGWADLPHKHALAVTLIAAIVSMLALPSAAWWRQLVGRIVISQRPDFQKARASVLVTLVLLVALHAAFGNEGGLWGIQPAEIVKLIVPLILATIGARFVVLLDHSAIGTRWGAALLTFFLALLAALGPALICLVLVDDLSPCLMLAACGGLWLTHLSARCWTLHKAAPTTAIWWLAPGLLLAGVLLFVAVVGQWYSGADEQTTPAVLDTSRLAVWHDPDLYPISGQQQMRAVAVVQLAPVWVDLRGFLGANGPERLIPAVQNDFIGAFILARAGIVPALLIVAAQAALIGWLLRLALRARDKQPARTMAPEPALLFIEFALLGLAGMQGLQFVIGWTNPLAALPVLGQSMTWFSSGLSHMGFAAGVLICGLLSGWAMPSTPAPIKHPARPRLAPTLRVSP